MDLHFVLGTAAELIKLQPLMTRARDRGWTVRILATGQSRRNLIEQAVDFRIDPEQIAWLVADADDLASSGAALRWFARASLARAPYPLAKQTVIVHGDTLSTLVAARLARRSGARVVHVEAGLRSNTIFNPFPEEVTRRLVSRAAHVHVVPDQTAVANLTRARVRGEVICSEGNTLMDAIRDCPARADAQVANDYVLVNVHRFENLNSAPRWRTILDVVRRTATTGRVVFIAHPPARAKLESDPNVLAELTQLNFDLRDRVTFSQFVALLKGARYLISDGGSNQEECSYLGIPCLLMRAETERREGLDANCVLTRFDPNIIDTFLANPDAYRRPPIPPDRSPSDLILDYLARTTPARESAST